MKAKVTRVAYRLQFEYDGGRYQGWQRQGERQTAAGVKTIAGSIERVLADAGHRPLTLMGSGRTDAGVHALAQVAHLHLSREGAPSPERLLRLLNEGLPHDIVATRAQSCPTAFHARHDAQSRTYLYCLSLRRSAFAKPWIWWYKRPLDVARLEAALAAFQGFRDVSAFADLDADDDPRCEVQQCALERQGSLLVLRFTASHFLRRQVRRMVGAAVACGAGECSPADLSRDLARPTAAANLHWSERAAPSAGLFLAQVRYAGDSDTTPPRPWFEVP